jgi:hypothetical protein
MPQAGRSRVHFFFFFTLHNPSSRTIALGFIQPLTEMSAKKCFWEVKRDKRVRLTNNLNAIHESTVYKM